MTGGWEIAIAGRNGSFDLEASFATKAGTTVLVGHNGAGKSTLLKMLVGARTPSRGHIRLQGAVLFDAQAGVDLAPEQRCIGYVPQGYGLFPHMSALDNVAFGLSRRLAKSERRERAREALKSLGVDQLAKRRPEQLSGGEKQRVALARAIAPGPRGLLLDEPLAALDATARKRTRSFLVEHLHGLDCPTLVVTHSQRDVLAFGDRVVVLEKGRIAQIGDVEELRTKPASAFVEEFFTPGW